MPAALSEQLADELGCSPDDAHRMLRDVLEDVEQRAQDGERVSIPGFGTFSTDEGKLQFTPDPALQQAVNYRNNHLEPLAVSGASPRASSDQTEPPVPPAETVSDASPDDVASPDPTAGDDETEPDAISAEKAPDEAESVDTEPVDEPAPETMPETEEVPDLSADWAEELSEREEDSPDRQPSGARGLSDRPNTGQLVGLVVSIVLLIGLIWFVLSSQGLLPGSSSQREAAPAATPTDTAAAVTSADTARPSSDEPSDTATDEATGPPSTPATIDRATGGWSIVVASRTRPGQAKAVLSTYQQRFQGEGIPVDILTGESAGQLRYRVAIGQYPSQEAAETALQELQGRVPDDAWTLQIQSDS